MTHEQPAFPAALLDGASVATVDERVAHRPWGNEGQASVSVVTLTLSNGATRRVVWKRARVPKAEPSTSDRRLAASEADKRLRSFEAEAAFFEHCATRLTAAGVAVPHAWSVAHSHQRREFSLLMSDLASDGFPRQPEALGFSEATAALRWLATLHAEFWDESELPPGLWRHGSYWDLGKRGHELDERRMSEHWRGSAPHLRRAAGRARDTLVPRLVRAALPLEAALRPPDDASPTDVPEAPASRSARRAPKRRAASAAVEGSGDEAAAAASSARLRLHSTIVHGDFKGENLFFTAPQPPVAAAASDRDQDQDQDQDQEDAPVPAAACACACAACDFQWAGRGVGSLDVLYLLTTSLEAGLLRRREGALLREYHSALCERLLERRATHRQREQASGGGDGGDGGDGDGGDGDGGASAAQPPPPPKEAPSWHQFELEYAVALLDFFRFVLGDGVLVDGDEWLVERAAALLERLDGGKLLSAPQYVEALNACADAAGGACALVGLVAGAE